MPITTASVYVAAFQGAAAGLAAGGKFLFDPNAGDYAYYTAMAKAFATQVDTAWTASGTPSPSCAEIDALTSAAFGIWCAGLGPIGTAAVSATGTIIPGADPTVPANYAGYATAVVAFAQQCNAQLALDSIDPNAACNVGSSGGSAPLGPNATWAVPNWWIDPVSGSDTNNGTTALTPLKTWRKLTAIWGTVSPVLNQNTTITFLKSQPDNSDPVVFRPFLGTNAVGDEFFAAIVGTPVVTHVGIVLSGTVPKNTAAGTNSRLMSNLGIAGLAISGGNQLVNTDKGSVSWVYQAASGTNYLLDQPLVAGTNSEDDSWADGDHVNVQRMTNVNIEDVRAVGNAAGGSNHVILHNLNLTSTDGFTRATLENVLCLESCSTGNAEIVGLGAVNTIGVYGLYLLNFQCSTILTASSLRWSGGDQFGSFTILIGGSAQFDSDVALGGALGAITVEGIVNVGTVYLNGPVIFANARVTLIQGVSPVLYGSATGTVVLNGTSQLFNPNGAFTPVLTAAQFLASGVTMNGSITAHSVVSGSPDVLNGGIQTTPANLDAAAGAAGFGLNAFQLGGASIVGAGGF
jgi:hypothetical protein